MPTVFGRVNRPVGNVPAPWLLGVVLALGLPSLRAQSQWTGASPGSIYYNGGNVGIGTTTPSYTGPVYPFQVSSFIYGDVSLTYHGSATMFGLDVPGNVEMAAGWSAGSAADYGYWLQVRGAGSAFPLFLNPLGGSVVIGSKNAQSASYSLAVDGTIGAKDIVVTNTGWADYVFGPNYRLRPLSEVKAYIQANSHLPEVPSEAEVKEKGVSVSEMQATLLAKVEELTLHMIQAEERNNALEQKNRELQERLSRLETKVTPAGAPVNR